MKKFLLLFLFCAQFLAAQLPSGSIAIYPSSFGTSCFNDTSVNNKYAEYKYNYPPTFPSDSGYIFGNNVYQIKEYVQVYQKDTSNGILSTAALSSVIALYSAGINNSNSNTSVKIYNVNPTTNEPTTLIATSVLIPMSQLNININYTTYSFSSPAPILYSSLPNKFAVAYAVPTGLNDSLAVYSTVAPCGGGDSLVWFKQADGSWIDLRSWFGGVSFNVDLHLHPVFDNTSSLSKINNPFNFSIVFNDDVATIKSSNNEAISEVFFSDLTGKSLKANLIQNSSARIYQLNDLQKGIYAVSIITKNNAVYNFKLIK